MLTETQKKELEEMYSYTDKANFTDEDLTLGKIMFDTPEKFALLRKMLQIFTPDERGLTIKTPQSVVQANVTDLQAYAIETAVNNLAEEKVKYMLFNFYRVLRNHIITEKTKVFEEKNKTEEKEEEIAKQFKEKEKEKTNLGKNL